MKDKILEQIKILEKDRNIRILFASESGSRAWGFPSPDSDYDVRFFYAKPLNWYLALNEPKDNIDLGVNELLDINGWDIRKALRLMKKSNVSPLEWMKSPIVYYKNEGFDDLIKEVLDDCFSPIASIHHYLSMAKRFYENCNGPEDVKLKSWFYGLRSSLNALWILEHQTMPPIHFPDALNLIKDKPGLVEKISKLIQIKATKDENYTLPKDEELLALMKTCIDRCDDEFKSLPGNKVAQETMNEIFRKIVSNEI